MVVRCELLTSMVHLGLKREQAGLAGQPMQVDLKLSTFPDTILLSSQGKDNSTHWLTLGLS